MYKIDSYYYNNLEIKLIVIIIMADPVSIGFFYLLYVATPITAGLIVISAIMEALEEPKSKSELSSHIPYYYDNGEYSDDENRPKVLIIPNKEKNKKLADENTMNNNTDNPRTRSQTRSVNTNSD